MKLFALLAAGVLCCAGVARAQVVETVDAGQTLANAQNTVTGTGTAVTSITGSTANADDVDLFKIYIATSGSFSASTINNVTGTNFDTKLYLFDLAGHGIATGDDTATGYAAILPAGNVLYSTLAAGSYYLGISNGSLEASNGPPPNQDLFVQETASNQSMVRGAAAGVNPTVLGGYITSNLGFDDTGAYRIDLTGVSTGPSSVAAAPEPAMWAMMVFGMAAVGSAMRRRRRATRGFSTSLSSIPDKT